MIISYRKKIELLIFPIITERLQKTGRDCHGYVYEKRLKTLCAFEADFALKFDLD